MTRFMCPSVIANAVPTQWADFAVVPENGEVRPPCVEVNYSQSERTEIYQVDENQRFIYENAASQ